jgi:DNA-binding MarR family transcriptional regulator
MAKVSDQPLPEDVSREISGSCLGFRMRLLSRVVARIFDQELRQVGLRNTQLTLLVALNRLGPVQPSKLVSWLELEKSTLSRNLHILLDRKLAVELPGKDGRSTALELTAAGQQALVDALPAWQRAQQQTAELLGQESGEAVRKMVRHLWRQ